MSLIQVMNLTFSYDNNYESIFEDVSFQLDSDWKLGFIGRNGRGKTTFLNLLQKKYEYSGVISSTLDFDYFPYPIPDQSKMTIKLVELIYPNYELWKLEKEMNKLELTDDLLYRPFSTLSNGEQTKLLLALLFLRENHFLLIDEPTNHLDRNARILVSEYLKSKKGFILVSHDRTFLDHAVDHILSINQTNIEVQKGNFSSWYANKQLKDQFELAEDAKLRHEIKQLERSARQAKTWADQVESTKIGKKSGLEYGIDSRAYIGEKSRRMQQRRKNLERRQQTAITEKSGLLKNIEQAEDLKLFPIQFHHSQLISLKNICLAYEEKIICRDISFSIEQGDRIALIGKNGSGKTSILKLLLGELTQKSGEFQIGKALKISYVSQITSFLKGSLTAFAKQAQLREELFLAILRKLDFSRVQFEKNMEDFSEGQKKKVLLAKSLCEQAHLYIWDEPLNFVDLFSRIQLEDLLLEYQPTLIFVEHDTAFVEKVATKQIQL